MADKGSAAYHIAVIKFAGEDRAKQVVDLIRDEERAANYKVKAWAVVEVDEKGKANVKQSGHGGGGAAVGGGTGVLLGLLGGPAGLLVWALGGALVGGLAGKYMGRQFDENQLKAVAASMEPNTSGLVVVIEDKMLEQLEEDFGMEGGSIVTITLADQISGEFAQIDAINVGEAGAADEADASGEAAKDSA